MFARFGREARRVIELAEDHARALWRPAVGPEHLLLALLAVDDSGAFVRGGLCFDDVRGRLLESASGEPAPSAPNGDPGHLPLRLRTVFRDAFREAAALGAREVTPLHLALALVDDPPGEIALVLRRLDVKAEVVRDAILEALLDVTAAEAAEPHKIIRLPRGDEQPVVETRTRARATR